MTEKGISWHSLKIKYTHYLRVFLPAFVIAVLIDRTFEWAARGLSVWEDAHANTWVHNQYLPSEISLSRPISRFLVILDLKELGRILTRQRSVCGVARNLSIRNVPRVGVALQRMHTGLHFTVWSCDHSPQPRCFLRICSGQSLHPSTKLWWSTVPLDQGTH